MTLRINIIKMNIFILRYADTVVNLQYIYDLSSKFADAENIFPMTYGAIFERDYITINYHQFMGKIRDCGGIIIILVSS